MAKKKSRFFGPVLQWIVAVIIAAYVWFAYLTSRRQIINYDVFKKYRRNPAIFAFWHGRMLMLSPIVALGGMRGYVVASQHSGGRMMAKVQRLFGLKSIYGSSSHGALAVLRSGVRVLRDGGNTICISPDGPGGPSMRVQDGALYFAKMSGAPIIPVCFSASRGKFLKRWDSFLIAKPFSRIVCEMGQPVFVNPRADAAEFEEIRKKLERIMINQVERLDAQFNLPPVEQGIKTREYKRRMYEMRAARKNKAKEK